MTKASGDKVKLPRDVVETIERLRRIDCTNADIIYQFASGEDKANLDFANFAADNFDTLLNALVNGYEVEQTPEDKVRAYYTSAKADANSSDYDLKFPGQAQVDAILYVLDALNIKIEGVND